MSTSIQELASWFQRGVDDKAEYMIVVCDTFDHDDYPVYTSGADFWSKHDAYNGKNMQRIMEVYDLRKPWSQQLIGLVFNTPPRAQEQ